MYDSRIINEALDYTRSTVVREIRALIEEKRQTPGAFAPLYDLLADYPFRVGKGMRPTLCVSVARAVGGMGDLALTSSTALELFHNAFLLHDDVVDNSLLRRGGHTLHEVVGVPRAVNVGDATNVLALSLLMKNLARVGVTKALHVLHEIEHMALQTTEGQEMELHWISNNVCNLGDEDYFRMCIKKTCWYSFITPCRIGYIVGHSAAREEELAAPLDQLTRFGTALGIAFQIQDDLLNLEGEVASYGKQIGGDLEEGKRTLMLNHVLTHAGPAVEQIRQIMALPRHERTPAHRTFILGEMQRCRSLDHARAIARDQAAQAAQILEEMTFLAPETPLRFGETWQAEVVDRRFLREMVNYVIDRNV